MRTNITFKVGILLGILLASFVTFATGSNSAPPDLKALSWMAGNWSGTRDGVSMEETWLDAKGNSMLGVHRDVRGGRTISFEFLRIEATADAITYWASPQGKSATPFRLVELKDKRVVFENAEHDFPNRIVYWLSKDGALHARIEGKLKGQPASEEWTWLKSQ
jgi:hypothetical protein